jgi:hypothetical protein
MPIDAVRSADAPRSGAGVSQPRPGFRDWVRSFFTIRWLFAGKLQAMVGIRRRVATGCGPSPTIRDPVKEG